MGLDILADVERPRKYWHVFLGATLNTTHALTQH